MADHRAFEIVPGEEPDEPTDVFEATPDPADQEHTQAATEAQEKADAAVQTGDYESAAEHRATAETEAGLAGNDSMLHGSSSAQLDLADEQQDKAESLQQESAQHAAEGNYEAAHQATADAATYQSWADQNAGGTDHSGLAEKEEQQLDSAAWEQATADENAEAAEAFAAEGDFDQAEHHAQLADDHQEAADSHGDAGEHEGPLAVTDPASTVEEDGSTT